MEKNKKESFFKKKINLSKPASILAVGLIVIVVPLTVFLLILVHAGLTSGHPDLGNRFASDLDPAISSSLLQQAEEACSKVSGVEKCDIQLKTAQMRVNVDAEDTATKESLKSLTEKMYQTIKTIIPVETYFTSNNGKKMYDLAINVYNKIDAEDENMIYYLLTKNATMSEPSIQLVSEAVNQKLAEQLRNGGKDPNVKDKEEQPAAEETNGETENN